MGNLRLHDRLGNEYIELGGERYHVNLSFDVVLRCGEIMQDTIFKPIERYAIAFQQFFGCTPNDLDLTREEMTNAVDLVYEKFIVSHDDKKENSNKKSYDIEQDADFIYATFLQDYNIDLFEEQGKLHWKKFLALLSSIREDTKLAEVIGIRNTPIPAPTKHNLDERKRIIKLKEHYALEVKDPIAQIKSSDDKLSALSIGFKK